MFYVKTLKSFFSRAVRGDKFYVISGKTSGTEGFCIIIPDDNESREENAQHPPHTVTIILLHTNHVTKLHRLSPIECHAVCSPGLCTQQRCIQQSNRHLRKQVWGPQTQKTCGKGRSLEGRSGSSCTASYLLALEPRLASDQGTGDQSTSPQHGVGPALEAPPKQPGFHRSIRQLRW